MASAILSSLIPPNKYGVGTGGGVWKGGGPTPGDSNNLPAGLGAAKKCSLGPAKPKSELSSLVSKAVEETFTAKLTDIIQAIRASKVPTQQSFPVDPVITWEYLGNHLGFLLGNQNWDILTCALISTSGVAGGGRTTKFFQEASSQHAGGPSAFPSEPF